MEALNAPEVVHSVGSMDLKGIIGSLVALVCILVYLWLIRRNDDKIRIITGPITISDIKISDNSLNLDREELDSILTYLKAKRVENVDAPTSSVKTAKSKHRKITKRALFLKNGEVQTSEAENPLSRNKPHDEVEEAGEHPKGVEPKVGIDFSAAKVDFEMGLLNKS